MNILPQFLLFCVVGVTTTAVDFAVFNLLTRRAVGWPRIRANVVSVSVAMTWSFLANLLVVFHPDSYAWLDRAGRFLVTTAFSAFVLQNAVLYLTTSVWKGPSNFAVYVARKLSRNRPISDDVISRNTCKGLAVGVGLIWNFCWYKLFVYAN